MRTVEYYRDRRGGELKCRLWNGLHWRYEDNKQQVINQYHGTLSILTEQHFPEESVVIRSGTFHDNKLKRVCIPSTMVRVESMAFENCPALESASVAAAVLQYGSFSGCPNLIFLEITDDCMLNGMPFSEDKTNLKYLVIHENEKYYKKEVDREVASWPGYRDDIRVIKGAEAKLLRGLVHIKDIVRFFYEYDTPDFERFLDFKLDALSEIDAVIKQEGPMQVKFQRFIDALAPEHRALVAERLAVALSRNKELHRFNLLCKNPQTGLPFLLRRLMIHSGIKVREAKQEDSGFRCTLS
ncbi:MAG: leucine-rich repeat protein [Coxiellaceae bacterium]|nr:leucine-rich repeat protein [Coxiellaceae bacterium]